MNTYHHIVCATDLTEHSHFVCSRAAILANCFRSKLTLLHVVEYFPEDKSNEFIEPEDVDPKQYCESEALKALGNLAGSIGCSNASRVVLFSSHSGWREIVRFAMDQQADLIVLTENEYRGNSALSAFMSKHRSCDVLTVHVPVKKSIKTQFNKKDTHLIS
jgi:universal stress protein A